MSYFPFLKGKTVLLVSHDLSISGAPLLLAETGVAMALSGAEVILTSIGELDSRFPLANYTGLRRVEIDDSFAWAAKADIIIANTAVAKTWVSRLIDLDSRAARKLIWWIHEIDLDTFAGGMECLGLVAAAVFDSESSLSQWQQTGLPLPATATAIHPGVTANFLSEAMLSQGSTWRESGPRSVFNGRRPTEREEIRTALEVSQRDFLITLIGSYIPVKGHDLLVETVGQLLDSSSDLPLKLLLVGFENDAQVECFLEKLSTSEFAAVGRKRVVTRVADPKPYYLASDAFVMNSQPPGEAFGRVSIEAMAFGLPVLGTDVGGTTEIVVDGVTGLLHPPGKEGQSRLSENIRSLMSDRPRARSLGKAGFERVETQFRAERFCREFARVMDRLVVGEILSNTL